MSNRAAAALDKVLRGPPPAKKKTGRPEAPAAEGAFSQEGAVAEASAGEEDAGEVQHPAVPESEPAPPAPSPEELRLRVIEGSLGRVVTRLNRRDAVIEQAERDLEERFSVFHRDLAAAESAVEELRKGLKEADRLLAEQAAVVKDLHQQVRELRAGRKPARSSFWERDLVLLA